MSENTRQVLEMLAVGRITTEEAERLLAALREPAGGAPSGTEASDPRANPRYLRVMVDSSEERDGPARINIRVPLQLLRAGVRLASLLPARVQGQVNAALRQEGIDVDIAKIKPENVDELIDGLRDTSVDIAHRDAVKIRVFTE